jgi:hypothetical protein
MEAEPDYQVFVCAHCKEEKIQFVYWDDQGRKFCSFMCRRRQMQAEEKALEAYPAN